jgi:hypothetical protein
MYNLVQQDHQGRRDGLARFPELRRRWGSGQGQQKQESHRARYKVREIARKVGGSDQIWMNLTRVIGWVTAMKMRLGTLLHSRRSLADAVGSYANSMKGVTCDTSAS